MTTRRLAAILAADVVGFSSMMEKDQEGTRAAPMGAHQHSLTSLA
jgi:class 3 adenylate cyclase